MTNEIKVEFFGRMVTIGYDMQSAIRSVKRVKNRISNTFIVENCRPCDLDIADGKYFYDSDIIWWLESKYGVDTYTELAIEDKEWTEWRNRDLNGIFYRKFKFREDVQTAVIDEATKYQTFLENELDKLQKKEEAHKAKEEATKAELLDGVKWETDIRAITDEGGRTAEYIHHITINGETYTIIERNVFDFGRVLNAPEGGAYSRKDGETYIETLTDNGWEKSKVDNVDKARAVYIVYKYGKYVHCGIRM